MDNLDRLLQRNKEFAAKQSAEGALIPPATPGVSPCPLIVSISMR